MTSPLQIAQRLATPLALAGAVVAFVLFFALLGGAAPLVRVGVPAIIAALVAVGTRFMLSRTPGQITDDSYHEDAREQVAAVRQHLAELARVGRGVRSPAIRRGVQQAGHDVAELLRRVEAASPTSLFSSAAQLGGYVQSLVGVVTQFADVEANPRFYDNADALLAGGELAMRRFNEFAVESIRLVNQGEIAEYQANLDTVAPPELPKWGVSE